MSAAASNANATGKKKGFLSGLTSGGGAGRTVFMAATATGVMAVAVTAGILGGAADTSTYYVLNVDVAARTQITPSMLKPVTTSTEGVPQSYGLADLSRSQVFAKYALKVNDTVTESNTGELEAINKDLPVGFVVASLKVDAENAVAGKIRGGHYVDAYAVDTKEGAAAASGAVSKLVLHHMLVLDVTVSPSTITQAAGDEEAGSDLAPGPESAAARGGIPSLYTVAVSPEDAAKIALIRDKNVFLTLSANVEKSPLNVQQGLQDVFAPKAVEDSGKGTAAAVAAAAAQAGTAGAAPVKVAAP